MLTGRVKRLRQAIEAVRRLAEPLTPAERRVLELHPAHGRRDRRLRLFVSTNTAKTHLRHLYTKFTTRSEAVERAIALGLLAPRDASSPVRATTSDAAGTQWAYRQEITRCATRRSCLLRHPARVELASDAMAARAAQLTGGGIMKHLLITMARGGAAGVACRAALCRRDTAGSRRGTLRHGELLPRVWPRTCTGLSMCP